MNDHASISCAKCKTGFWIPNALYHSAKASESIFFYCPFGHSNYFPAGETAEDVLRRESQRLAQRIAQRDDEIRAERNAREHLERQLKAQRGVVTRIKNRVGHGVCPCCQRTFENVQKHMHSKHPEYAKSDVILKVVNGASS